jgi:bifunctional DNase/RNase
MIRVKVQSLGLDQVTKSPVVILQELDGERVLPIWIGPAEASAIAMELAGMKFSRPLTHDLFGSIISGLGGRITRALITRVQDNTYFAELVIQRGEDVFTIDARPSDSIAIALRADAELYAGDELFASGGVDQPGAGDIPPGQGGIDETLGSPPAPTMDPEALKEHLRKLNPEDLGRFNP